jgi:hypothetical protein
VSIVNKYPEDMGTEVDAFHPLLVLVSSVFRSLMMFLGLKREIGPLAGLSGVRRYRP